MIPILSIMMTREEGKKEVKEQEKEDKEGEEEEEGKKEEVRKDEEKNEEEEVEEEKEEEIFVVSRVKLSSRTSFSVSTDHHQGPELNTRSPKYNERERGNQFRVCVIFLSVLLSIPPSRPLSSSLLYLFKSFSPYHFYSFILSVFYHFQQFINLV